MSDRTETHDVERNAHVSMNLPAGDIRFREGEDGTVSIQLSGSKDALDAIEVDASPPVVELNPFGTQNLVENVSRSTGVAAGWALLATSIFYAALVLSQGLEADTLSLFPRLMGVCGAGLAVALRLEDYRALIDRQLATEAALGVVRVPVLTLLLLVAAAWVWPRRRRVLQELGIRRKRPVAHLFLTGLAFLVLPYGSVAVRNPHYQAQAPRGEDARRVALRVLSETYRAFNLRDEDELYDRLSESVTEDLIDDGQTTK